MEKIICTTDVARTKINQLENKNIDEFINNIVNDINYISLLDTLYLDAYLILSYKKKINLISKNEEKVLNKLNIIILKEFTLYIVFQNDKEFIKELIKQSSIFRKSNIFLKSKIYYLLSNIDKGILSNINYRIYSELYNYDLSFDDIKKYIINSENEDISNEFLDYIMFLYINKNNKYKQLSYKIRMFNNYCDLNIDILTKDEIDLFIKKLKNNNNIIKLYKINKR